MLNSLLTTWNKPNAATYSAHTFDIAAAGSYYGQWHFCRTEINDWLIDCLIDWYTAVISFDNNVYNTVVYEISGTSLDGRFAWTYGDPSPWLVQVPRRVWPLPVRRQAQLHHEETLPRSASWNIRCTKTNAEVRQTDIAACSGSVFYLLWEDKTEQSVSQWLVCTLHCTFDWPRAVGDCTTSTDVCLPTLSLAINQPL